MSSKFLLVPLIPSTYYKKILLYTTKNGSLGYIWKQLIDGLLWAAWIEVLNARRHYIWKQNSGKDKRKAQH